LRGYASVERREEHWCSISFPMKAKAVIILVGLASDQGDAENLQKLPKQYESSEMRTSFVERIL
jgi:hypothetical protein